MQIDSLNNAVNNAKEAFKADAKESYKESPKKKGKNDTYVSEEQAKENLEKAIDVVMESIDKMIDNYNSIINVMGEASAKISDLIDKHLDKFNDVIDILDTRLEQMQLLVGDRYNKQQVEFYDKKVDVNISKLSAIAQLIEKEQITVKEFEQIEASNKELSTEQREALEAARDKINELQKEQLNTEAQLLQDIVDRLSLQTTEEMRQMVNSMFGGTDTE